MLRGRKQGETWEKARGNLGESKGKPGRREGETWEKGGESREKPGESPAW